MGEAVKCISYLHNNIILAMLRGHMKQRVSTHVHNVWLCPTHKESINDVRIAIHTGVVEWSEAMLISKREHTLTSRNTVFKVTSSHLMGQHSQNRYMY